MKQALHIFAKDARHFWPEISISVVITAVFAWIYPNYWKAQIDPSAMEIRNLQQLASLILLLVPLSWWVLITRVVHGETLVGDKQWWVTKPYAWPQLLGAKLMFVAAFVLLPLFVAQCVLLEEGGFRWFEYLPGLGFNLVLAAGIVLLPLLALATVTSGFGKLVLTLLGLLAAFIVLLVIAARDRLSLPIVLVFSGAAILLQYARRMALQSRLLLVSAVVLLTVAGTLCSAPGLVAMAYPVHSGSRQYQVAYDKTTRYSPPDPTNSRHVMFTIPLAVSGIADGDAIGVNAVRVTFESADGQRWASSWEPMFNIFLRGDAINGTKTGLPIHTDRRFFEHAQKQAMNVHLELAITELKAGEDRTFVLRRGEFEVPDVGICAPMRTSDGFRTAGITCRSPMREPKFTYVSVRWADSHCTPGAEEMRTPGWTGQTLGNLSAAPADFGITSVWSSPVWMNNGMDEERDGKIVHIQGVLCTGTPIHFTHYVAVGHTQVDATLADYHLPPFQSQDSGDGATMGIGVMQ
jgi:hypothetical protein